jgi:hypothetical protein
MIYTFIKKYNNRFITNSTHYWADAKSNEVLYFEVVNGRNIFYHETKLSGANNAGNIP